MGYVKWFEYRRSANAAFEIVSAALADGKQ